MRRPLDPRDLARVRGGQLEPTSTIVLPPPEDAAAAGSSGTGKTLTAALLGKTP